MVIRRPVNGTGSAKEFNMKSHRSSPSTPDKAPPPRHDADESPSEDAPDEVQDPRRWFALAVIAIAQLMIVLDGSIVNIALPSAQHDLHISDADRQWVVTAYTLAFGGLLLLGGRIADYAGRKRVFIVGLFGFAGASALGGFATSAAALYASRGLQGAFAALLAPAALSLLTVTFTRPKERATAFGVFGAIAGGGAALGLLLGGVLTEYASWRWCLGVNVPIAVVTALLATRVVRESRASRSGKYDLPGAVLVTGGLVSLVYGFSEAGKLRDPGASMDVLGWSSRTTLGYLTVATVLLTAFVLWERYTANPLLPLRVLLDRNRGGSYAVFLFVGAALFSMFLFLTFYLQTTLDYSPLRSGFAFLPFSLGIIVTAAVVSQLLPRSGPKPLMTTGLILSGGGMLWLTQITVDSSYWSHVLPALVLISVGLAAVFIPASSTALRGVSPQDAGVASAVLNTSQQVGGSLGTALLNTFYASAVTGFISQHERGGLDVTSSAQLALVHGYHVTFLWTAIFLGVGLILTIVLINARRGDDDERGGDEQTMGLSHREQDEVHVTYRDACSWGSE